MRELHDWLAVVYRDQGTPYYELNVPEHIVKRLTMQLDRIRFYLPEASPELAEAGRAFHNCVASYGQSIREGKNQVVFMTDDNGKLTACLDVRGNKVVQAKMNGRNPVAGDPTVNNAVLEWAQKAMLTINTTDFVQTEAIIERAAI